MALTTPSVEDMIAGNKRAAAVWQAPGSVAGFIEGKWKLPTVMIVTCMDARVVPEKFCDFGLENFMVIRTIGGRARNAVRDIAGYSTMINDLQDVVIIHHTDCGMTHFSNEHIRNGLKAQGLDDGGLNTYEFGEIKDKNIEQSVKADVAFLRSAPYINPKIKVRGFTLDLLGTGQLTEVEC